ncbi:MAG: hypothetical protein IKM59_01755 [Oscillospiraceae bacterium]|nr:hypothetical protein [Oscillospiraceae bacterium]
MIGMLLTHIRRNGQMYLKSIALLTCVFVLLFTTGCSFISFMLDPGEGRGDWTIELINGYCINRINGSQKVLSSRRNSTDTNGSIVLHRFYITSYQISKHYICLEGISTREAYISEKELEREARDYYLVSTTSHTITGPFESIEAFLEHCSTIDLNIAEVWTEVPS